MRNRLLQAWPRVGCPKLLGTVVTCAVLLGSGRLARAQQFAASADASAASALLPVQPETGTAELSSATISGTVIDTSEGVIPGALVTLIPPDASQPRSLQSDSDGAFAFQDLAPGDYKVSVEIPGFTPWSTSATLEKGENLSLHGIALAISPVSSTVEVRASRNEVAAAQLGLAEKQRVLGVFPNFYASYVWNAEPLSSRQKYSLAWRFSLDPVAFGMAAVVAGTEQSEDGFSGYGGGVAGYGKRLGATFTDGLSSTLLGQAILPSLFHQDPRFFVKGTGSVPSRALYAVATTVICKGDNRRWQVNYSNILGNVASAGISNLYYPATNRHGMGLTVENSLLTTAFGAAGGLIQEFFLHRMTPNLPNYGTALNP